MDRPGSLRGAEHRTTVSNFSETHVDGPTYASTIACGMNCNRAQALANSHCYANMKRRLHSNKVEVKLRNSLSPPSKRSFGCNRSLFEESTSHTYNDLPLRLHSIGRVSSYMIGAVLTSSNLLIERQDIQNYICRDLRKRRAVISHCRVGGCGSHPGGVDV